MTGNISDSEEIVSSGNELIDATQNAIIGAAENVSEVFEVAEKTLAHAHAEDIPFYADVEFWVGMAFILAIAVLAIPACRVIKSALQKRVMNVVNDIEEAIKLRDDAQTLLANYERKFADTEKEAAEIVERARQNIEMTRQDEIAKMQAAFASKEKEVKRRITSATEKARNEINLSASRISIVMAQAAIQNYLNKTDKSRLIDDAIDDLDKLLPSA